MTDTHVERLDDRVLRVRRRLSGARGTANELIAAMRSNDRAQSSPWRIPSMEGPLVVRIVAWLERVVRAVDEVDLALATGQAPNGMRCRPADAAASLREMAARQTANAAAVKAYLTSPWAARLDGIVGDLAWAGWSGGLD